GGRGGRTGVADLEALSPRLMIGAADPKSSRVFWAYKSQAVGAAAGRFDKLIGYDIALDRFIPPIAISGEYLSSIAQPGVTLEGLDSISGSLDALTQSPDSVASAPVPEIAAGAPARAVGLSRGASLEATLTTAEQGADDQSRFFVRALRPISDAPAVFGSIARRETQQAAAVFGAESGINRVGECAQRISTR